jgi:hypothetical protein
MDEPLNDIPSKQNTDRFLEYIAAARSTYSHVKDLVTAQVVFTVVFPIALSILAILSPERKVWAAFTGIIVSMLDVLVFEKLQKDGKKEAARIQERLDCELFELEWNEFKVGDKPPREKIHKASEAFLRKDSNVSRIKDWYSPHVERLPLHLATVVCQRSNIYWDSELRRSYVMWITGLAIALGLIALISGLAFKMSMETFVLTLLAPISPTLLWAIREVKKQRESAATLDRLMKYAQQLWRGAIDGKFSAEQIAKKSRTLQDEIFAHRYSNQPIFDWISNLVRKRYEVRMNLGAEELVAEAIHARHRDDHKVQESE